MKGRLARSIGANLYGQLVTIAVQVVSVPCLIHAWGTSRYGVWILLSALPTALSFADGGLVLASGNAMTIAIARGDLQRAATLFREALSAVAGVVLAGAVLAGVILPLLPDGLWPETPVVTPDQTRFVILALVVVVLLGLLSSLLSAGFRASGRYPLGIAINDSIRLFESAAVLVVASLGSDLRMAAAAWLLVRALGVSIAASMLVRVAPWVNTRSPSNSTSGLRSLLHPALAALAVPAAFAVSLQGATLALATAAPAGAVALFTAIRTLSRAMVQASGLVNHALMPEMAIAVGRGDRAGVAAIAKLSARAAVAILLPGWTVLVLFGSPIVEVWTRHLMHADPLVIGVLATAALLHGLWLSAANMLLAVNRQADYAWAFLACASLSTVTIPLLAAQWGLLGAAWSVLAGEGAMAVWLLTCQRRSTERNPCVLQEAGQ